MILMSLLIMFVILRLENKFRGQGFVLKETILGVMARQEFLSDEVVLAGGKVTN